MTSRNPYHNFPVITSLIELLYFFVPGTISAPCDSVPAISYFVPGTVFACVHFVPGTDLFRTWYDFISYLVRFYFVSGTILLRTWDDFISYLGLSEGQIQTCIRIGTLSAGALISYLGGISYRRFRTWQYFVPGCPDFVPQVRSTIYTPLPVKTHRAATVCPWELLGRGPPCGGEGCGAVRCGAVITPLFLLMIVRVNQETHNHHMGGGVHLNRFRLFVFCSYHKRIPAIGHPWTPLELAPTAALGPLPSDPLEPLGDPTQPP